MKKIVLILLTSLHVLFAANLNEERPFQPVILYGSQVPEFLNVPTDELFIYRYSATENEWSMIPFQIDERVKMQDPYFPSRDARHFYAINNTSTEYDYAFSDTLPNLDIDDELVFLIGDAGDQAPDDSWIDNAQAKTHDRVELILTDPLDTSLKGYVYVYRSSTLTMPEVVANKYQMAFEPETQTVSTKVYSLAMSDVTGLVKDITVNPPFGSGVEFFDTQKIRFNGFISLGGIIGLPIGREGSNSATENYLYVYPNTQYLSYNENPVVRVVREARHSVQLFGTPFDQFGFYVKTFFYPYSGTIEGGARLDSLNDELNPNEDYYVELDMLRQSWDYNQQAVGMKYYNAYNDGIPIDGMPDNIDPTVHIPIQEWSMVTGDQGTFYNLVHFEETNWEAAELYYWDSADGGQADSAVVVGEDTGDMVSYGDNGITLREHTEHSSLSLELGFTAYFLEKNATQATGIELTSWVLNPVKVNRRVVTEVKDHPQNAPREFRLNQNYPNPFNGITRIEFSLPHRAFVTVTIFDAIGKNVKTLYSASAAAGSHHISWDGSDQSGNPVASGVYFYKLETSDFKTMKKMLYLR